MDIRPPQLNLPAYDFMTREVDGIAKVYDPLRQKYVAATPEEWVRLHLVQALIEQRAFPRGLMKIEQHVKTHGLSRFCDVVVYDRQLQARMIIECKAPEVKLTQAVFDQIAVYNVAVKARWLLVSNGREHYCCTVDLERGEYRFETDLPTYTQILE